MRFRPHRLVLERSLSLLVLLAPLSQARAAETEAREGWHCITDHLEEAMALNQSRKPLYSSLSDGASEEVSDALIAAESKLLASLAYTKPLLKVYWSAGVPALCREFAPMSEAPDFSEIFPTPVPEGRVAFADPRKILTKLEATLLFKGRKGLIAGGRQEIARLDKADHFQCMMKHVLESVVRAAEVADEVNRIAERQKRGSTYWLSDLSIQSQLALVFQASELDRKAEAMHRQGIPIICNDVPVILKDLQPAP